MVYFGRRGRVLSLGRGWCSDRVGSLLCFSFVGITLAICVPATEFHCYGDVALCVLLTLCVYLPLLFWFSPPQAGMLARRQNSCMPVNIISLVLLISFSCFVNKV